MAPVTKYRLVLGFFMVGLILSGITAFPLAWELQMLTHTLGIDTSTPPAGHTGVAFWLATVDRGLHQTYAVYPFGLAGLLPISQSRCISWDPGLTR